MNLEVDYLIHFFQKNTPNGTKEEMEEQDDAAPASAPSSPSSGGGSSSVPKWADSYPLKRGKANMLWKSGEKWNTGLTRGAANQIW
jgi:hypothetical protein